MSGKDLCVRAFINRTSATLETNTKHEHLLRYTCLTLCQAVFERFPLRLPTLTVFFERGLNVKV